MFNWFGIDIMLLIPRLVAMCAYISALFCVFISVLFAGSV